MYRTGPSDIAAFVSFVSGRGVEQSMTVDTEAEASLSASSLSESAPRLLYGGRRCIRRGLGRGLLDRH